MSQTARGRYAPSPSGRLHLGNARTALLAWLDARARAGSFVLRVEDLDPQRSKPEHERHQLADLRWLGLDWDEGPDVGGPQGPYRQSQRGELYQAALERLDTYRCVCTRKELRESSLAPHGAEPIYPGTCRARTIAPDEPASLRWRVPAGELEFTDRLLGPRRQDVAREVGDFVLRRSDGAWAYQLAVVVDDAAMAIGSIVRGADLLDSTARQILLARTLGLPSPTYAHVPLIVGADGEKLSKRHGAPELGWLRARKVDPRRVVALLARSCGLLDGIDEPDLHVEPRELIAGFELTKLAREPGPLDLRDLANLSAP